jgi:hypothetical protein
MLIRVAVHYWGRVDLLFGENFMKGKSYALEIR